MLFSERQGLVKVREALQRGDLDHRTRVGLWNAMHEGFWEPASRMTHGWGFDYWTARREFVRICWDQFFREPLDQLSSDDDRNVLVFREWFLKEDMPWNRLFDFMEFLIRHVQWEIAVDIIERGNEVLDRERAGYRIIDVSVVEVTSPTEVQAIVAALDATEEISGPHSHLQQAVRHLADRQQPDLRNSVKEAISAVEAVCQFVTHDPKASLGDALKGLESDAGLHPALKKSFSNLYGYTSDADGIRHAMLEESKLQFADAKFMLVTCCAFVNYLLEKTAR